MPGMNVSQLSKKYIMVENYIASAPGASPHKEHKRVDVVFKLQRE